MSIPMTSDEWRNVMRNADESNPAALGRTVFQLDDRIAAALKQRERLLSLVYDLLLKPQEVYDSVKKAWAAIEAEKEGQ